MEPLRRLPVRAGIANRDRQMDPWRGIGRGRLYNQEHIQFLPGARQGGRNLANVQIVNVQNVIKQLMDRPNRPKQDPQVSRINVEGDILSYHDTDGRRRVGVYIAGIPLVPVLNYFEVEVLDTGLSGSIAVGLVPKQYRMDDQPGWNADSVAYHLDDGKLFKANGRGRAFGTPCEVGDKVGCGIKFQQLLQDEEAFRHVVPVFFTKNGKEIGTVLTPMPQHGFFPAVGMHSEGEEVRIVMEKTWECNDDILMSIDNFEDEWARLHDVRLNGQLLEYTGRGKSIADVGLAQAKLPLDTTHHYFEIEIVDPGENCYIAIGLARKDYPSRRHPGWNKGSVAYHADDGKVFIGSGIGDAFGPKCNKGDIMGCGILFPRDYSLESDVDGVKESDLSEGEDVDDYIEVEEFRDSDDDDDDDSEDDRWWEKPQPPDGGTKIQVFFTKNGKCVGRRDTRIPPGGFYPTVGMLSSDEKVRVDLRPLTG